MVNSSIHFIPISINQLFVFREKKVKVYNTIEVAAKLLLVLHRGEKMSYATN